MNMVIVDDHAIVRIGLKQLVQDAYPYATIWEAGSGREALMLLDKVRWDLAILDVNLPDQNGVELLKAIKLRQPLLPVMMLSLHPEEQYALRALKAGAAAYLTKERAPEELVTAIKQVLAGRKFITATLAERLATVAFSPVEQLPHERLSDREFQVLCAIGKGKTVSAIAGDLSLSVKTVSTYRTRLLDKLHMKNTTELIRYTLDHTLV
ncbi:MAG TPA: response regulator transcription factor [Nitrospira sp.]|nr:response regulator transcription factor [Nitrospira sp.]